VSKCVICYFTGALLYKTIWFVLAITVYFKFTIYPLPMTKQKNTDNKKKHTRLMDQKKNKNRSEKELRAIKLKEMARKINEQKNED
jgi:hypothetical protein